MNLNQLKPILLNNNSNIIKIYFGIQENNEMFKISLDKNVISNLETELKKKYNVIEKQIFEYYYEDKILYINGDKITSFQEKLIDKTNVTLDNSCILISCLQKNKINNILFPCKKNYHSINENLFRQYQINNFINLIIKDNSLYISIVNKPNLIKYFDEIANLIIYIDKMLKT